MRKALAAVAFLFATAGAGLVLPATPSGATGPAPLTLAYLEESSDTFPLTVHQYPTVSVLYNSQNSTYVINMSAGLGNVAILDIPGPLQVGISSPDLSINESGGECSGTGASPNTFLEVDQLVGSGNSITSLGLQFDCELSSNNVDLNGTVAINIVPTTPHAGYYMYGDDGSLVGFGNDSYLNYLGDLSTVNLNQPIVGMATTQDDGGYWMTAADGGVFSFGDAQFYGSTGNIHLNKPIVGMTATPDGKGYWFVASDGGVFAYGDAQFWGSTGAIHLNQPIVGMAATPDGRGYWLVASDGGIFAFGDAQFFGSTGALHLNKPIVGMVSTPDGKGYWMVATDGGIFTFGTAAFHGSTGSLHLNQPIVGMLPTEDGGGYWMVAADGGIFTFGDATFQGSIGGQGVTNVVGLTS